MAEEESMGHDLEVVGQRVCRSEVLVHQTFDYQSLK